jgi:hypothetical protein
MLSDAVNVVIDGQGHHLMQPESYGRPVLEERDEVTSVISQADTIDDRGEQLASRDWTLEAIGFSTR